MQVSWLTSVSQLLLFWDFTRWTTLLEWAAFNIWIQHLRRRGPKATSTTHKESKSLPGSLSSRWVEVVVSSWRVCFHRTAMRIEYHLQGNALIANAPRTESYIIMLGLYICVKEPHTSAKRAGSNSMSVSLTLSSAAWTRARTHITVFSMVSIIGACSTKSNHAARNQQETLSNQSLLVWCRHWSIYVLQR